MLLRPRQKELVDKAVDALHTHGNTLAVAPTGAGKTIMLSAAIGALYKASTAKTCVLAHRDELTTQNQTKFRWVNPHLSTSLFDASTKSWEGDTTFAMVQTLCRQSNLDTMPSLDLLVIDEAHHARADSYVRIINHAKSLNPKLKLLGMTATPNRGDKKGLHPLFSNVCDQITLQELIFSGHLVRPRTFVMDVGVQQALQETQKDDGEDDLEEAAQVMNTKPINDAVVAHWKEKAGDRQTVVFCSTVEHAHDVCHTFRQQGVAAVFIYGDMSDQRREEALNAYTTGQAQVIVNVAVLTEGWDHPPTSCVVLLRPSSYKSTFIQMIGRGLRPVSPKEHPGLVKTDCLILDFGTATLLHGSIEQTATLEDRKQGKRKAPTKACFSCQGLVPSSVTECPLCGYVFPPFEADTEKPALLTEDDFVLREVNLFKHSHFMWIPVDDRQESFMARGFEAWGHVFFKDGQWHAVGASQGEAVRLLAVGEKTPCLAAANDWMNLKETQDSAHKAKEWLTLPVTPKQLHYLPEHIGDYNMTRYKASILMTLKFNAGKIDAVVRTGGTV